MARKAREKSNTGIYHIMHRGNDRLFDTKESYVMFMSLIEQYIVESDAKLYAYSLLSDRIHLVIKEGTRDIASIMKTVSIRYARYFNNKTKTNGKLFYGRFQSEPVESEEELAACVDFVNRLADIFMEKETACTSLDQYNGGRGICTDVIKTKGGKLLDKLFMEEYRFMNLAYTGRFIKARCGYCRGDEISPELKKSIIETFREEKRISVRSVCEVFGWNGARDSAEIRQAARLWE